MKVFVPFVNNIYSSELMLELPVQELELTCKSRLWVNCQIAALYHHREFVFPDLHQIWIGRPISDLEPREKLQASRIWLSYFRFIINFESPFIILEEQKNSPSEAFIHLAHKRGILFIKPKRGIHLFSPREAMKFYKKKKNLFKNFKILKQLIADGQQDY